MASNELGQFRFGRLETGHQLAEVAGASGSPHQEARPPERFWFPAASEAFRFLRIAERRRPVALALKPKINVSQPLRETDM